MTWKGVVAVFDSAFFVDYIYESAISVNCKLRMNSSAEGRGFCDPLDPNG